MFFFSFLIIPSHLTFKLMNITHNLVHSYVMVINEGLTFPALLYFWWERNAFCCGGIGGVLHYSVWLSNKCVLGSQALGLWKNVMTNCHIIFWRRALEEFVPTLHYIPAEDYVVADALSCRRGWWWNRIAWGSGFCAWIWWAMDEWAIWKYTIGGEKGLCNRYLSGDWNCSSKGQANTKAATLESGYTQSAVQWYWVEGKKKIITVKDPLSGIKWIIVLKVIRERLVHWYHTMLVHQGSTRLCNSLYQHFTWHGMRKDIQEYTLNCDGCQRGKQGN